MKTIQPQEFLSEEEIALNQPHNCFEQGEASGNCWSDGHYLCRDCKHYRADFKKHGQGFIDFAHNMQGGLQFNGINLLA